MKLELFHPVKPFKLHQEFGVNGDYYRQNGINIKGHNGWDYWAPDGYPVRAAHDGKVTRVEVDSKGGIGINLRTIEKFEYKGGESYFKTIYWHLKTNRVYVRAGDIVKVGDIIAQADNTGFSTGSHLHFALKPCDKYGNPTEPDNGYSGAIDNAPYMNGYYAENAASSRTTLSAIIEAAKKAVELLTIALKH